ncbi:hypothetical protein [Streptomyces collinus]
MLVRCGPLHHHPGHPDAAWHAAALLHTIVRLEPSVYAVAEALRGWKL